MRTHIIIGLGNVHSCHDNFLPSGPENYLKVTGHLTRKIIKNIPAKSVSEHSAICILCSKYLEEVMEGFIIFKQIIMRPHNLAFEPAILIFLCSACHPICMIPSDSYCLRTCLIVTNGEKNLFKSCNKPH